MEAKRCLFDEILLFIGFIIIICMVQNYIWPQDDFLRDVISYKYSLDYRNLYIHSPLMTQYNQYILFDYILGVFSRYNIVSVIWYVKNLMIIMYSVPVWLIVKKLVKNHHPDVPLKLQVNYVIFYSTLIMVFLSTPIVCSRPQVLFGIWTMYSYLIYTSSNIKFLKFYKILWVFIGIVLIPFYWLAVFYLPAILFVFKSNKNRLYTLIAFLMINFLIWNHLSNGQWIQSFSLTNEQLSNRVPGYIISENMNPYLFLFFTLSNCTNVFNLFLLYLTIDCFIKSKLNFKLFNFKKFIEVFNKYPEILFILIYLSTNMNKYLLVMYPILIFSYIKYVKIIPFCIEQKGQVLMMLASLLLGFSLMSPGDNIPIRQSLSIPKDSKVLSTFNGANFIIPIINKNTLKIFPSMEIGAGEKQYQQLALDIEEGLPIDCKLLSKSDFEYVATKKVKYNNQTDNCLQIYETSPSISVFKIIR